MPRAPDPGRDRPRYREYAPAPDLAHLVRCFWHITANNAPPTLNRICPDGCADIVVTGDGEARAIGTMRSPMLMTVAGRVDIFGVRFQPGEALAFFDLPLDTLTDGIAGMDDLGWRSGSTLGDQVASAGPSALRVAIMERLLRARRAACRRGDTPAALRAAIRLLERRDGVGLQQVRNATGASQRTLERQFREMVGLSPKAFGRVARFRRALRDVHRHPRLPYAALAAEAGYADQAHFIREFRSFAGITPAAYVREWCAVGFVQYGDPLAL
ncbi:MAG TPA: helix-turn-helix domain-containing protein [Gemmatimonadales bacterium]|nr:helix-turn-helix domain-containing protein [Gemmatimonadales bacterium]